MSFFNVTIETIESINPHSNADKLEIAKMKGLGFQFIVPKGQYSVNQKVLYFPIDAVLPPDIQARLGLVGKLSGSQKDRIKTVKLRGEISQGVVGKLDSFIGLVDETMTPEKITEVLGVTKYEPPAIPCKNANLYALPFGLTIYDIEGAERNSEIVQLLMEQKVIVTEKMEGSNFSISYDGNSLYVNQRRHTIIPKEGEEDHTWWKVAKSQGLVDLVKTLQSEFGENSVVTLYGEMVGPAIQGNIYKFPDHRVYLFDMKVNGEWVRSIEFIGWLFKHKYLQWHVPILNKEGQTLREYLNGKSVVEASNGDSVHYPTLREGIVIKPFIEQNIPSFGRLFIKQRCPIYLANSDN